MTIINPAAAGASRVAVISDLGDLSELADYVDLGALEDLDDLGALGWEELQEFSQFSGFWSKALKGLKKVAKVAIKNGLPVLKASFPGISTIAEGVAKVGKFVVKTPILKKALQVASTVVAGPLGPAMVEVVGGLVEQSNKKTLINQGKIDTKTATGQAPPDEGEGEDETVIKFSNLPPATVTEGDIKAIVGAMAKLAPVDQKIMQAVVRAGIDPKRALSLIESLPKLAGTDTAARARRLAALGSLMLEEQDREQGR